VVKYFVKIIVNF